MKYFLAIILVAQWVAMPASAQDYYYQHRWHHWHPWYDDDDSSDSANDAASSTTGSATSDPASNPTSVTTTGNSASTPASNPASSTTTGSATSNPASNPASATTTGSSSSGYTGGPPVSGMVLTFDDEFNTLSASSSGQGTLWQTRFYYNSLTHSNWSNLDLDPAVCDLGLTPYSISNGILDIHEQNTDPRLAACGVTEPYTSGNLYSYYSFSQEYGYFEVRAQASSVAGTDFAFWMLPKDGSWPPEIDITEVLGREPTIDNASNHYNTSNTTITFPVNAGTNLAGGFHIYGVLWDATSITYMLDGQPVAKTSTQSDENKPFYMILGLGIGACGDGWAGCPADPSHFSADVYVDYVRVWQFADQNPAACVGDCGQ